MKDLIILGRKIGTYEGWDEIDVATFGFYGYDPIPDFPLEKGALVIAYDLGYIIQVKDLESKTVVELDLIETLKDLPKIVVKS
jgi:hypothetical protein